MRMTLTFDENVADRTKALAVKTERPFKKIVNEALRRGLDQMENPIRRPFQTKARPMGLKPGYNLDNIQEILAHFEGN